MYLVRIQSVILGSLVLFASAGSFAAPPAQVPAAPQAEPAQLDGSKSLFAVLAAINAAGYDDGLDSPSTLPYRRELRRSLAARNLKSVHYLKEFFAAHRKANGRDELSQYISYGLSVDGPPEFKWRYSSDRTPPAATALEALGPLLKEFWNEAHLERDWEAAQPVYDEVIARYHAPITEAIFQANMYLRNPTSGSRGRRFQIYIDLLGAPNQVHARAFSEDYFVVITPALQPRVDDIRRSYLHYLIDPWMILAKDNVEHKHALCARAMDAPALSAIYKEDCVLLFGMSLVRAVEARLDRKPEEAAEAMKEGFVLTAAFYDALATYEKQEPAMRFALREIVEGLNTRREGRRIDETQFYSTRLDPQLAPAAPAPADPLAAALDTVDARIKARDLDAARALCRQVIEQDPPAPVKARAYFGLARVAALSNDAPLARELFTKTLTLSPEPFEEAWSHVYLARLAMAMAGDNPAAAADTAVVHYTAALAIAGASDQARAAAQHEIEAARSRKQQNQ